MKIIRFLLVNILIISFLVPSFATKRNVDEAANIALGFLKKAEFGAQKAPLSPSSITAVSPFQIQLKKTEKVNSDKYFHVFNAGDNHGFVIVSANERAKTILGYSTEGNFDVQNLPENLQKWLSVYANEIESLELLPETSQSVSAKIIQNTTENSVFAASVLPLLKNIKWNQNSPYNLLCPIIDSTNNTRAAVGCGATALAMVMKYYNWPLNGTGSNSYTTETLKIPLSVDFSKTQYDWANMTGIYNSASTEVQKNAVATLMYHAAVAVNMDFNKSSSSYTTDIARALFKYFSYDTNVQVYIRNFYNNSEWNNLIKTELNNNRPVLYNGQADDSGHIFVCDGYDENGLYHINWGWGGISDGYFELSALNPSDLGIGGGNAGGYNSDQYMIIGIQKPNPSSVPTYLVYTNQPLQTSVAQVGRSDNFNLTTQRTYNYGINTLTGSFGVGLFNGNNLVQVLNSGNISIKSFYGWSSYTFNNLNIPTSIAAGNYRIYLIYKESSASNWSIVRGKTGTPNYLNVTVESALIKFSVPTDVYPSLTLNVTEIIGSLYQNKTGRFKLRITNDGGEYNSTITLKLQSSTNQDISQIVCTDPVNIPSGVTKDIYLNGTVTLAPAIYQLAVFYDTSNNITDTSTLTQLGNTVNVEVLTEPTEAPVLTLNKQISFADPQNIFTSNATLSATITNSGGYFENKLIAYIFPPTPGYSLTYIGYQTGILDNNETKTFNFSGSIALDPGDYRIGVYYYNPFSTATSKWTRISSSEFPLINFTLKEDLTSVDLYSMYPDTLFPNPASDFIYLKSEQKPVSLQIMDIYGKTVRIVTPSQTGLISENISDLHPGAYLLQTIYNDGIGIHKFIKK